MDLEVLIRQLQGRVGDQAFRSGVGTVSWPGGADASDATTVTHGLGRTPTRVFVSQNGGSHYAHFEASDSTWDTDSFDVDAYSLDGTPTIGQEARFSWFAIA